MTKFRQIIRQLVSSFFARMKQDSLFANSVYLMASTVVQAVLGFGFWVLCARLFRAEDIGLASTLISASTFIAYVSLLGFNSVFIRYLPTSKSRNTNINTGLVLVALLAVLVAAAYVQAVGWLAPALAGLLANWPMATGFVVLSALGAVNLLTDSIFIAYRAAMYNLIIYSVQSTIKLLLPIVLATLGAYGVFAASGAAAALALILSLGALAWQFGYRPSMRVSKTTVVQVWHFASTSYVANLLNIVPTLVLPVVVLNELGAAAAGFYYLALMLANLVYTIGYSVAQSLFAEGSYGEDKLGPLVVRSTKILAALMIPAGLGLAAIGPLVLELFGKQYSSGGTAVLVVLAISAPFVTAYVLSNVLLRLRHQLTGLVATNVAYVVSVCGLAVLWAPKGLVWVGLAWLAGNALTAAFGLGLVWRHRQAPTRVLS